MMKKFKILCLSILNLLWLINPVHLSVYATEVKPINNREEMRVTDEEIQQLTPEFKRNMQGFSASLASAYLLQSTKEENRLISPISVRYAFSALAEGASGNTADELARFIYGNVNEGYRELNRIHKAMLNTRLEEEMTQSKLVIKDSVWLANDLQGTREDFLSRVAQFHYAEVYKVNHGDEKTAKAMNDWVKQATNNLINPERQPNEALRLLILNTIYFKDNWKEPFIQSVNTKETFTTASGEAKQVDFMHAHVTNTELFENDHYIIASLPFEAGSTFKILLPKKEQSLETLLSENNIHQTLDTFLTTEANQDVHIQWHIPRYTVKSEIDLKELMSLMGYDAIFNATADFSNLAEELLFVSEAKQLTHFILNNEGVEAAAYTEIGMETMAVPIEDLREVEINLNKPFLYCVETPDGTPLFVGIMNDPTIENR